MEFSYLLKNVMMTTQMTLMAVTVHVLKKMAGHVMEPHQRTVTVCVETPGEGLMRRAMMETRMMDVVVLLTVKESSLPSPVVEVQSHLMTTAILSVVMEWSYHLRHVMMTTLTILMAVIARVLRRLDGHVTAHSPLSALECVVMIDEWLMKGATMEIRTTALVASLTALQLCMDGTVSMVMRTTSMTVTQSVTMVCLLLRLRSAVTPTLLMETGVILIARLNLAMTVTPQSQSLFVSLTVVMV